MPTPHPSARDAALLFNEPIVRTRCQGIPIRTYGYMPVLTESPDLLDAIVLQKNNSNPFRKVSPRKSGEEFISEFSQRPAKQIWIVGEDLARVENWLFAFSIAEVEVYDVNDQNVALAPAAPA